MKKNISLNQRISGFTLIEMAIVMVIGGILLSFMGSALLLYVEKSRVDKTEVRMKAIQEALSQYLSVNRRYPCVARQDIAPGEEPAPGTVSFGREVSSDCLGDATGFIAGTANTNFITRMLPTTPTPTTIQDRVRIGSVPVRSLNLPDEMAFDGWGRRFTYAVSTKLASSGTGGTQYTNDGGFISISDNTGTSFVSNVHYALVSHGRSGDGGLSFEGNSVAPCSTTTLDRENCDNDAEFMVTLVNSEADATNFFDDYVYYQGQTAPPLLIPAGAVMAFDLPTCPDGWADFTEAEGKFIVGANNGVVPDPPTHHVNFRVNIPHDNDGDGRDETNMDFPVEPYDPPVSPDTWEEAERTSFDIEPQVGNSSGPSISGIPPYHALLYCEKLPQ